MSLLTQFYPGPGGGDSVAGYSLINPVRLGLPDPANVPLVAQRLEQPVTIIHHDYGRLDFHGIWSYQPPNSAESIGMAVSGDSFTEINSFNARPVGGAPCSVSVSQCPVLQTINGLYVDFTGGGGTLTFSFLYCYALTTVNNCTFILPYTHTQGITVDCSGSPLNSASVDEILTGIADNLVGGVKTGTVNMTGSCAPPGPAGLAAINTIASYGILTLTN